MKRLSPTENLLRDLGVASAQDIDIEAIAYHVGAVIKYRPLNGCEGRIIGVNSRAIITINSQAIPARQRFSAAHEMGHWHFDRGRSLMCRSDEINNPKKSRLDPERIADGYAADLLMPQFLFEPMAIEIGKVSFDAVETLRKEFKTSIRATALRLVEHGPEPAILVCHTASSRKWFYPSHYIPERWFPRDDLDQTRYAMVEAESSDRIPISADIWFDRRGAENYEIYEETLHIPGDDEILTLLIFDDDEMLEDA